MFSQEKLLSHMRRRHPKKKESKYKSLPFIRDDDSDDFEPDNFENGGTAVDSIEMDDEFEECPTGKWMEHCSAQHRNGFPIGDWEIGMVETDWYNGSEEFDKQLRSGPSKSCVESTLMASGGDKLDKELPDRVIRQTGIDAAPAMVDWDFSGELWVGGGWVHMFGFYLSLLLGGGSVSVYVVCQENSKPGAGDVWAEDGYDELLLAASQVVEEGTV